VTKLPNNESQGIFPYVKLGVLVVAALLGTKFLISGNFFYKKSEDTHHHYNKDSIIIKEIIVRDKETENNQTTPSVIKDHKKVTIDSENTFFNSSLKDASKKNIAFLIENKNLLDRKLIRRLNSESIKNKLNPVNLFNQNSLSKYDELINPSETFVTKYKLKKATDIYFVASISQRPIPNGLDKSMFSSVIEIDGILVNLNNNEQIPFSYPKVREMGMSQEEAHSNAVDDLVKKILKFVMDNSYL
jgi:hypothetical protein